MRPSSGHAPALSPDRAWFCLLINQAATPGLGSLRGGRRAAGTGQLLLALAGFCLIVGWMFRFFENSVYENMDEPTLAPLTFLGNWGAVLFGAAWVWAWFTSVSMVRQAVRDKAAQPRVPPKLD